MGRKEVIDAFKDRAVRFLREAISDLDKGWYDFAIFHAEQSLQLALKAMLLESKGSYPLTHDLDELINSVKDIRPELFELRNNNKDLIQLLKLSYTGSRYFPVTYDKDVSIKLINLVKQFLEVMGLWQKE
ncbi:HEPN domain-containing protein [Caldivirga sp.]|uniref:HEPN domain-containing protein n=1 Tax=Caldivirga sp. TaxID=2080243 RepID=UPI003D0C8535